MYLGEWLLIQPLWYLAWRPWPTINIHIFHQLRKISDGSKTCAVLFKLFKRKHLSVILKKFFLEFNVINFFVHQEFELNKIYPQVICRSVKLTLQFQLTLKPEAKMHNQYLIYAFQLQLKHYLQLQHQIYTSAYHLLLQNFFVATPKPHIKHLKKVCQLHTNMVRT